MTVEYEINAGSGESEIMIFFVLNYEQCEKLSLFFCLKCLSDFQTFCVLFNVFLICISILYKLKIFNIKTEVYNPER